MLGCLVAAGTGVCLIIYSIATPISFKLLVLPFPIFDNLFFLIIYFLIFLPAFCVIIPAAELSFYTVFFVDQINFNEESKHLEYIIIAGSFAGLNWIIFMFLVGGFIAQIVFTLISFGFMIGLLLLKEKKFGWYPFAVRVGWSLGLVLWFMYLAFTRWGALPRKSPDYYYGGSYKNIWRRVPVPDDY